MPYSMLICKDCDRIVCGGQGGPHGPEDERCDGEGGFEWRELYDMDSLGDQAAWHRRQALRARNEMVSAGEQQKEQRA